MKAERGLHRVIVTRKAARALAGGHPWVYASEVIGVPSPPPGASPPANGDLVDVIEENGTWRGTGLLSERSTIRVRIVSRNANDRFDDAFWRRRIAWAWRHRVITMGGRGTDDLSCCRVIFGEADGLPGLVVDRYGSVLVTQVGTVGMERLRPRLYPLLLEVLREAGEDVDAIFERCDTPSRSKEGLDARAGWWDGGAGGAPPRGSTITVRENGASYVIDLAAGQKTGFFLDQKYNRRAVARIADGRRVLDCFSHVGPFGINAALAGACYVRCVDASQPALDRACDNARLNGIAVEGDVRPPAGNATSVPPSAMGFTRADVIEYLPQLRRDRRMLEAEGGPFDLIILDPPAFTKSRAAIRGALRGYRKINADAMRLLPRGGYLATCSCSHFMSTELLRGALDDAARDADVRLRQVEQRQQSPDHPILWGFPQSHYLDFFIFQVV